MKQEGIILAVVTILLAADIGAGYFLMETGALHSAVEITVWVGAALSLLLFGAMLNYCIVGYMREWKKIQDEPPKK